MQNRRILKEWTEFRKKLLSPNASEAQVLDMRRAFYGGVAILNRILRDLDESGEPTEADLQILRDINQELTEYMVEVKAGKA